jgi:hypothetical protein
MTELRRAVGCAVLLLSVCSGSDANAEASDALSAGRSLWRSFEYEDAIVQLQSVVDEQNATVTQRLEALELLAVLHLTLRRQALAQQTFVRLLAIDPQHELSDPGYPPRVQDLFRSTRDSFIPQTAVDVAVDAPDAVPSGARTLPITATVSGDTLGVERTLVYVRAAGEATFRSAMMRREGLVFAADVPAPAAGAALSYYVEVQAPSGFVIGRRGSAEAPEVVAAAPPLESLEPDPADVAAPIAPPATEPLDGRSARRPIHRQWWFWTIIGAVVVGGTATGLAVGLQPDDPSGTLGAMTLP